MLYIIATPIGNLEDITLRAIRVLKEVDLVLAEDSRVTRKLFEKYQISTPIESYHAHSTDKKIEKITTYLSEGRSIALVTDAGTPGIADPGSELVRRVRETEGLEDIRIEPIPGASSLAAALSVSGMHTDQFLFLGFLPHKKGRETIVRKIAESEYTTALFESPHRILKLLASFNEKIPERKVVIARELTKMFEEVRVGTAEEHLLYYGENKDKVRGEFVVIVEACHS